MRLLIIGLNFAPELTGVGKYTGEMASWLAERGHHVSVITAPPYYPEWKINNGYRSWVWNREVWSKCTVIRSPIYVPERASGARRIAHLASFALSSAPACLTHIARNRFDIVIAVAPTLLSAPLAIIAARFCSAKSWLHIQDLEIEAAARLGIIAYKPILRAATAIENCIIRRFDLVSTVSRKMLELTETKGVLRDRMFLFPNWVDTMKIFPIKEATSFRRELKISEGECVALYSGSMGKKQGLEHVIAAARLLASQSEKSPLFVLAGAGPARTDLENSTRDLDNIKFLPLQPNERLNDLLNLADIHLLPERLNASDLVMPSKLTAMLASGKPVIATVPSDSQVALTIGDAGAIVRPEDSTMLANAIRDLAKNPARRQMMGTAARKIAQLSMDKESLLLRMEEKLQSLLR